MPMLGDFLFQLGYQVVIGVVEFGILLHPVCVGHDRVELSGVGREVLDERVVIVTVDLHLYLAVAQLG